MKKLSAILLSAALLLSLLSGCGNTSSSESAASNHTSIQESSAPEVHSAPSVSSEFSSSEASNDSAEEASVLTGAIIPAEECQARGYPVKYGMYDFETYVALPLTGTKHFPTGS